MLLLKHDNVFFNFNNKWEMLFAWLPFYSVEKKPSKIKNWNMLIINTDM